MSFEMYCYFTQNSDDIDSKYCKRIGCNLRLKRFCSHAGYHIFIGKGNGFT